MTNVSALSIPIVPDSAVYATYRRISYKPWAAMAEFVDNSTQNFWEYKDEIAAVEGNPAKLMVEIFYDSNARTLTVADNANGMDFSELTRAVRLNQPPPNTSGRCEFGMGLKMAACWFGNRWRVVTKRLNSPVEYTATVDVANLEANSPESIEVLERGELDPGLHYTRIEIEDLHRLFRGRTASSIRENIASIYRRDIASGEVTITWNGEPMEWGDDPVFEEMLSDGTRQRWEKQIQFSVDGYQVSGRVWLRVPGEAKRAGMHLFRRGRLVIGGPAKGYKPWEIFKAPNSFQSQRLMGELDLDNWPVTQTKDEFDWSGELESQFVDKLVGEVADYVAKAPSAKDPSREGEGGPTRGDAELIGDVTKNSLSDPEVDEAILIVEQGPPPQQQLQEAEAARLDELIEEAGTTYVRVGSREIPRLKVCWSQDMATSDIYAEFSCPTDEELVLVVNLNHPFVTNVIGKDPSKLETYDLILFVDALVERGILRRNEPVHPRAFRVFKDQYLRRVQPGE